MHIKTIFTACSILPEPVVVACSVVQTVSSPYKLVTYPFIPDNVPGRTHGEHSEQRVAFEGCLTLNSCDS